MDELAVLYMSITETLPMTTKDVVITPPPSPLSKVVVVSPPFAFKHSTASARAPRIPLLERDKRIAGP